jgi:hypothetical protein
VGTDIINTTDALVAQYDEMIVNLGPPGGNAPGDNDLFEDVYCLRVVQSASGSRLDFAELIYNLDDHLINRAQPANFAQMIDVRFPDALNTLIHRGDYVRESASVQQSGEALTAQSQVRGYHFGDPVTGYDVYTVAAFSAFIHSDIVFNPSVDDRTLFNMSNQNRDGNAVHGRLFVHPECVSGTVGETWQGQTRSEWTLSHAVRALCWLLNPDEDHILNPDTAVIDLLLVGPSVRAVTIPIGTRLPQALDALMIPLGFSWYLDYSTADNLLFGRPTIKIFQIGVGTEKELKFQLPGAVLDPADSNVNQFSTDNNIGDSFNVVTVLGEREEAECTFPLFAGWDSIHDGLSPTDLDKDGAQYVGHETVWRLFIANEAGDINPATARLGQTPTVPDLTGVFEHWVPHRRTLQEPLTYIAGTASAATALQERRPHVVEYSIDSGATWLAAAEGWTIKLCPDQIGILFDMKSIPQELYDAGSAGRLRITGSVFADSRINHTATRNAWAVNGRTFENVIVKPDKFQYRFRNIAGTYQSVLTGSADTKDDSTEIQEFAEAIRDQNQYAEVDCEFRLPGWHTGYEIGDLITKIAGREISLDAAPAVAPVNRYVQVVERRFEMTEQGGPSTVLIVDRGVDEQQGQRLDVRGQQFPGSGMAMGYGVGGNYMGGSKT